MTSTHWLFLAAIFAVMVAWTAYYGNHLRGVEDRKRIDEQRVEDRRRADEQQLAASKQADEILRQLATLKEQASHTGQSPQEQAKLGGKIDALEAEYKDWASNVFHHRREKQIEVEAAARKQELAQLQISKKARPVFQFAVEELERVLSAYAEASHDRIVSKPDLSAENLFRQLDAGSFAFEGGAVWEINRRIDGSGGQEEAVLSVSTRSQQPAGYMNVAVAIGSGTVTTTVSPSGPLREQTGATPKVYSGSLTSFEDPIRQATRDFLELVAEFLPLPQKPPK
jgi:hypothetical protein